jgi:hypothetical protein
MKKLTIALALVSFFALALASVPVHAYTDACWGQASAAFAQMGQMGQHASQQETPRDGLANLARDLYYEAGVLDAPTLQALGAYLVSIDSDLTVEACME